MQKGVRWIKGREYLLCGRAPDKAAAMLEAVALAATWQRVRIIKYWECDYALYVHGFKGSRREAQEAAARTLDGEAAQ